MDRKLTAFDVKVVYNAVPVFTVEYCSRIRFSKILLFDEIKVFIFRINIYLSLMY